MSSPASQASPASRTAKITRATSESWGGRRGHPAARGPGAGATRGAV